MKTLLANMRYLCDETRMLTGITAAYGTPDAFERCSYGRAREFLLDDSGAFIPAEKPLSKDHLYDLASLTKLFTAVAALQLVESGKLSLEETIGEIDSRFINLKNVRLFDVLSFNAHLQTPGRIDAVTDRSEGLRRLYAAAPAEPPRIRLYSDINAMIVKYVVEQRTGMAFADVLSRYIFAPCGMNHTFSRVPEAWLDNCVCYNYEHRIADGRFILRSNTLPGTPHDPKAALLSPHGDDLCGHAGLFSTSGDMVRFAQALLNGELVSKETLASIGVNRTGCDYGDGTHRQYLGFLSFTKHPNQYLSEVPAWMSDGAFGLSGFTGNHLSLDPLKQRFVLFLGNRCHCRVSNIAPADSHTLQKYGLNGDGTGSILWPDGRRVSSSARYVHFKDIRLHAPIFARLKQLGWL